MDLKFVFFVFVLQILTASLSEADTQSQPEYFTAAVSNFSSELYQVNKVRIEICELLLITFFKYRNVLNAIWKTWSFHHFLQ